MFHVKHFVAFKPNPHQYRTHTVIPVNEVAARLPARLKSRSNRKFIPLYQVFMFHVKQ